MSRNGSKLPASPDNPSVTPADRITVTLIPRTAAELQTIHERTGLSKTDIVNRAISLYEFVDTELSEGGDVIVRRDGEQNKIKLL